MPKTNSDKKEILATRLAPKTIEEVYKLADKQGLSPSEWLRTLILNELTKAKIIEG